MSHFGFMRNVKLVHGIKVRFNNRLPPSNGRAPISEGGEGADPNMRGVVPWCLYEMGKVWCTFNESAARAALKGATL